MDSWTSDLCVSVGGMSSMGRCYTCAESQLSQLERQRNLGNHVKDEKNSFQERESEA